MTLRSACNKIGFVFVVLILVTHDADARQRDYGARSAVRQSAGLSFSIPNFGPDSPACLDTGESGECLLSQDFEFSDPVIGLFYSREGLMVFIGRGTQNDSAFGDMELLETILHFSGTLKPFPGTEDADIQFVVPVALHSDYRRLSSDVSGGSSDRFESTVIALGAGVGVTRATGYTRFAAHVMPFFGLASTSFGLGSGTSSLLNADAELTFGPISGSIGITIGYAFRWQHWNLEEQFVTDEDFTGKQHSIRIGVFW